MSIRRSASGSKLGRNSIWSEDGGDVALSGDSATLKFREDKFVVDVDLESASLEQSSLELTSKEERTETVHPRALLHLCKYRRDWLPKCGTDLVSEHEGEDNGRLQNHDGFGHQCLFRRRWVFCSRHSNIGSLRFYKPFDLDKRVLVPSSDAVQDVHIRWSRL